MTEQLIQAVQPSFALVIHAPGMPQEFFPGYEEKGAALHAARKAVATGIFEAETPIGAVLIMIVPGTKFMVLQTHEIERQMRMAQLAQPMQGPPNGGMRQ